MISGEKKALKATWWKVDCTNKIFKVWFSQTAVHISRYALKMPLLIEKLLNTSVKYCAWNEMGRLGWKTQKDSFFVINFKDANGERMIMYVFPHSAWRNLHNIKKRKESQFSLLFLLIATLMTNLLYGIDVKDVKIWNWTLTKQVR